MNRHRNLSNALIARYELLMLLLKTLKSNLQRQKKTQELHIFEHMYKSGELVYLLNNSVDVGLSRKLKPIYKGPYIITEVFSPSLYRIEDRCRDFVVHHD